MSNLVKKVLVYAIVIIGFGSLAKISWSKYQEAISERDRFKRNWEYSNFEMEVRETKNKELAYSVKALSVKADELKNINSRLYSEITNLKLEAKKLQALTEIKWGLEQKIDTIHSSEIPPINLGNSNYAFNFKDEYSTMNGMIIIPEKYSYNKITQYADEKSKQQILEALELQNPGITKIINNSKSPTKPYINNFQYSVSDSLLIIPEFEYRRSWIFWKKVTGVRVHVKSVNPNFKIDQIQTYQIIK